MSEFMPRPDAEPTMGGDIQHQPPERATPLTTPNLLPGFMGYLREKRDARLDYARLSFKDQPLFAGSLLTYLHDHFMGQNESLRTVEMPTARLLPLQLVQNNLNALYANPKAKKGTDAAVHQEEINRLRHQHIPSAQNNAGNYPEISSAIDIFVAMKAGRHDIAADSVADLITAYGQSVEQTQAAQKQAIERAYRLNQ